jgi:hypothetical protein
MKIILIAALLTMVGCAHRIEFTHFETGLTLVGSFNSGSRMVTVKMPNGEVLSGKYVSYSSAMATFGTGSATAFGGGATAAAIGSSTAYSVGGKSSAYALLKSKDNTSLMMEVVVNADPWSGHGNGEAVTNDGRKFKVTF